MKRLVSFITVLMLAIAAMAQTLNITEGNVSYQYPASLTGDMFFENGGTTLNILGKTFSLANVSMSIKKQNNYGGEIIITMTGREGIIDLGNFSDENSQVIIPEEAQSWISVVRKDDTAEKRTVSLRLQSNTTYEQRNVHIVVKNKEESVSYLIKQDPNYDYLQSLEREFLIGIYNALDGDHWINNENWCSDKPVETWYGISTYKGLVRHISLGSNNLKREISSDMFKFPQLNEINLEDNPLTFKFSESMPDYLDNIQKINILYCNTVTTFPEWFFTQNKLRHLSIGMEIIPKEIGLLTKLEYLTIYTNQVPIPAELGNLTNLRSLSITGFWRVNNKGAILPISEEDGGPIPDELGNLSKLVNMDIELMNCVGNIPTSFGQLTNLSYLNLNHNRLKGDIPKELGNLPNLSGLSLNDNRLDGEIPDEIGNIKSLITLDLSNNLLKGKFPDSFCNFPNLIAFNISDNLLSGSLPENMGQMFDNISLGNSYETAFNISRNYFIGKIPESIISHSKWKYLWYSFINGCYLDNKNITIPGPDINGMDVYGNYVNSEKIYKDNVLTILYQFPIWFSQLDSSYLNELQSMKDISEQYKNRSVKVILYDQTSKEDFVKFVDERSLTDWYSICTYDCPINGLTLYPTNLYPYRCIVDNSGNIVFD